MDPPVKPENDEQRRVEACLKRNPGNAGSGMPDALGI